ncbi:hypothetical protein [Streptomyces flaveolus]|uniref:hypothetical protein n=1 Tax=Streptomyces flaveolus TaxID=67297 RepID=UPI0033C3C5DE
MADGVAATALWALVEEAEIEALAGDPSDMQRFAVGGATVVLGTSGSVVITAAGDALGDSGVWSAEEVRLVGEAPAPVTKRLLGDLEAWGADESSLPIHLAVRVAEGLLYLGTGRRMRAHIMQPPDGGGPALTSCGLRLDTRLSRPVLALLGEADHLRNSAARQTRCQGSGELITLEIRSCGAALFDELPEGVFVHATEHAGRV